MFSKYDGGTGIGKGIPIPKGVKIGKKEGMIDPAAAAKSLHSCPTLCDPMDCSAPGSPVPGILQARTLKWVAISFSSGPHSVRPLRHDLSVSGGPPRHGS